MGQYKYEDNKRVAIITLYGLFNCGNRLQNYAIDNLLKKRGLQPVTLLFSRHPIYYYLTNSIKRLLGMYPNRQYSMSKERRQRFEKFDAALDKKLINHPEKLGKSISSYVIGSDQVWNPSLMKPNYSFAEFAQAEKKIAVAASFGISTVPLECKDRIIGDLESIPYLSVREEQGARIIYELTGRKVQVLCDPTLVLKASEWRALSRSDLTPDKSYVFVYMLGEITKEQERVINEVKRIHNCEAIYYSDKSRAGEVQAGPAEFLSLVDHASQVITDSFHATVFSALFKTPLTIMRRTETNTSFSRLETLAGKLQIHECIYAPEKDLVTTIAPFSQIDSLLKRERDQFNDYLDSALKGVEAKGRSRG